MVTQVTSGDLPGPAPMVSAPRDLETLGQRDPPELALGPALFPGGYN